MSLIGLRIAASILVGTSVLTVAGPMIGELVATMAPPFGRADLEPTDQEIPYEQVEFASSDGLTLRGWLFRAKRTGAPAVVYAPATAHDQRSGLSLVPALHAAGFHVLLFSYRGHGLSDGNRWGFTYGDAESRDLDAAVRYLQGVPGLGRIGVIGYSVGAASSIISAARNPGIAAVVAVAPFTCIDEIWSTNRPPVVPQALVDLTLRLTELRKGFRRGDVCPVEAIGRIAPRPLLVIHGTDDRRITQEQARRLYDAAGEPKALWLVEGATHPGVRDPALDQLLPDVIDFLDAALRPAASVVANLDHGPRPASTQRAPN